LINDYAREHNFYPNVIAETLRNSRVKPVKIIGVIVPQFTHFYFSSILSGIEEEASARGYRIMVAQSSEKYEREVSIVNHSLKIKCVESLFLKQKILQNMIIFRV